MKTQARIGLVLCLFALAVSLLKIYLYVSATGTLYGFFNIDRGSYILYTILFALSIFWDHWIVRTVQVSIILFEGFLALSFGTDQFAGYAMIISAIFILCAYRFFKYHRWTKIFLVSLGVYIILAFFTFANSYNRYIIALEWLLFMQAFLAMSWVTFKDYIDKIRKDKERILEVAEEAASIARDAIELEKGK